MSDLVHRGRDTCVTQHRHPDGTRTWRGAELALVRALTLADRNGRLVEAGEVLPAPKRPGEYMVRVRLVEAAPKARKTRPAPGRPSRRVVWLAIAATGALGLVGIAVALLLDAIAAIIPLLLGVAVVLLFAWLILRGNGGGGGRGGGFTLTQSQSITFH